MRLPFINLGDPTSLARQLCRNWGFCSYLIFPYNTFSECFQSRSILRNPLLTVIFNIQLYLISSIWVEYNMKWNTSNLMKSRCWRDAGGGLKWLLNWNSGPFTFRIGISITNAVVQNYQLVFDWFQLINNFTQNNTQIHSKNTKFAAVVSQLDCGGLPTGFEPAQPEICRCGNPVDRRKHNLICAGCE